MVDPFEEDDVEGVFPGSTIKKPAPIPTHIDAGPGPWRLEVLGAPRTKKTSNELHLNVNKKYVIGWIRSLAETVHDPSIMMRSILSRTKVQPSTRWRTWAKKAPIMMPGIDPRIFPIKGELHIRATFYRESKIGDLVGFMQGIADLLEKRQVVVNDRQLVNWDGTRLDKDKSRPRVELTLSRATSVVPRSPENADQLEVI